MRKRYGPLRGGYVPKHLSHTSAQSVVKMAMIRTASSGKVVTHPAFGKALRAVSCVAAGLTASECAAVVLTALVQALLPGAICASTLVAFIADL